MNRDVIISEAIFRGAILLYGIATAFFFISFAFRSARWRVWGLKCGLAGVTLHLSVIIIDWIRAGHGPYMTRHEVLSANALIAVLFYYTLVKCRPKLQPLGVAVFPAVLLTMGLSVACSPALKGLPPSLRSSWLVVHVLFAKLAFGSILIATAIAFILLFKHDPEWYVRHHLPPVNDLEETTYRILLFGFFSTGVMISAGAIWAEQAWGRYWGFDPVETGSLAVFLSYGVALHLRRTYKWTGRRAAWAIIAAFIVSVLFFFIEPLWRVGIHAGYFL